jgi:hypothetical protein
MSVARVTIEYIAVATIIAKADLKHVQVVKLGERIAQTKIHDKQSRPDVRLLVASIAI